MLQQRIEARWIDCFAQTFALCGVKAGDTAAILSETQSRPVNVQLAELALARLGARAFHLVLTSPKLAAPVPVRSTGASDAIARLAPVVQALAVCSFVADLTVEGLLHAAELPEILQGGARVLMVSNEHPEILERCMPNTALEPKVKAGMKLLRNAKTMHVTSGAGTDLHISLEGARTGGGWGYTAKPGSISHWPGGLCLAFPAKSSVNGRLVLDQGDVNLTFKRYLEKPVVLTIENDFVTDIAGQHVDADLMRSYWAAWGDREAYAVSHVGWGMNPQARWDAMAFYDKNDFNGTELRAFAGNFLYSTGANEAAGRHTLGHFDLPLRGCTVALDGQLAVDAGRLCGEMG
ncbi:peptidase M29 [Polaromonas sp. SM01]|uniref:peptidase M29 n=1 Tax=Polaromonas sp. SM01 TaxID=3085630 RepID=UPI002980FAB3|nr:peptidase M29 [Polaromonas sp. SM01]MDW5441707.1 peptidase M29 [Polaromonas sp. SM01]